MAILKFGTIVTAARGTIAGTIFSANKAGPYAKAWARPAIAATTKQRNARAPFSGFASVWRSLSGAQRTAWASFAADPAQEQTNSLGDGYYLSGWQWFCKLNGWRMQPYNITAAACDAITPAIIEDAPATGASPAPTLTTLTAHYGPPTDVSIAFTTAILTTGEYLLFAARPAFTQASNYVPPTLQSIAAFGYGATSPIDLSDAIDAALGGLRPGAQLQLQAFFLPTSGYRSTAAQIVANTEA